MKNNKFDKKYKNKENFNICEFCDHCIYIGEGDSICDVNEPEIVLADWEPTDMYWYCAGSEFETDEEADEDV